MPDSSDRPLVVVEHNPDVRRFEAHVEGHLAQLNYMRQEGRIFFTYAGVPRPIEGRGIGSALVRAGLEYARREGLAVVPMCSFVRSYIERHPEYHDLWQSL
jgi:predicted GNAT family acetyltransferase